MNTKALLSFLLLLTLLKAFAQDSLKIPCRMALPICLTLTNLTGRALHTQQLTQAQTAINLSSLPQGVFFCHLASTEINVTAKIVKGL